MRDMKRKYEDEINVAAREKRDAAGVLIANRRRRPLMLGYELDTKIQSYLTAVRSRGGLVSQAIAIATAEAIIQNNPDKYTWYRDLDLHNSLGAKFISPHGVQKTYGNNRESQCPAKSSRRD